MNNRSLRTAVAIILPAWLAVRIIACLLTYLSFGAIDLTIFHPSIELGFQVFLFYIKSSALGLAVFIAVLALQLFGTVLAFFVVRESRTQNKIGFFSYAVIMLMDLAAGIILGMRDGIFFLSALLSVLILLCLTVYGRELFSESRKTAEIPQNEAKIPTENNP